MDCSCKVYCYHAVIVIMLDRLGDGLWTDGRVDGWMVSFFTALGWVVGRVVLCFQLLWGLAGGR